MWNLLQHRGTSRTPSRLLGQRFSSFARGGFIRLTCTPWCIKTCKGKGKEAVPQWGVGEVLISQTLAVEPVGGWTTESATHGQCDARPTVTFPAAERRRPLAGTKLYCLVTEAHGCEQLVHRVATGRKSNSRPFDHESADSPLSHRATLVSLWAKGT